MKAVEFESEPWTWKLGSLVAEETKVGGGVLGWTVPECTGGSTGVGMTAGVAVALESEREDAARSQRRGGATCEDRVHPQQSSRRGDAVGFLVAQSAKGVEW